MLKGILGNGNHNLKPVMLLEDNWILLIFPSQNIFECIVSNTLLTCKDPEDPQVELSLKNRSACKVPVLNPTQSFINHRCEWVHIQIHRMHANAICLDKVSTCDSGLGLWFWVEACWDQSTCAFSLWSGLICCVFKQMILLVMSVDLVL